MSNDININNLRELHAATTQGEWYQSLDGTPHVRCGDRVVFQWSGSYSPQFRSDAKFAVAAHNIWKSLFDELERLRQKVAELTKACEQYQEHSREMTTACARLRGENELRQEAAAAAMEERDELRNALQELLDFSDVLHGRHFVRSNQARENAGKLLKQHTATE